MLIDVVTVIWFVVLAAEQLAVLLLTMHELVLSQNLLLPARLVYIASPRDYSCVCTSVSCLNAPVYYMTIRLQE